MSRNLSANRATAAPGALRQVHRAAALPWILAAIAAVAAPLPAEPDPATKEKSAIALLRVQPLIGEEIRLADRLAKGPVVFDFWATWCRPCALALPEVQKLHEKYAGRGLSVIGVSLDGPRNAAKVRPFAAQLGLTFPNVLDDKGELQRAFQVQALPTTVVVSPEGEIISVRMGYRPGEEKQLAKEIEKLLLPPDSTTATPTSPERES